MLKFFNTIIFGETKEMVVRKCESDNLITDYMYILEEIVKIMSSKCQMS